MQFLLTSLSAGSWQMPKYLSTETPVLNTHVLKLGSFGLSLGPMLLKESFYLSLPFIFKYMSLLCIPLDHFESCISSTWSIY